MPTHHHHNRFRTISLLTIVVTALAFPLTGCGDARRCSVDGIVLLDGQPLPRGSIQFRPHPGTDGPTAGANIENGEFLIDKEAGTFAGNFRVEIYALRPSRTKRNFDEMSGTVSQGWEQYLPAKYNKESKLAADITNDGPNALQFDLTLK